MTGLRLAAGLLMLGTAVACSPQGSPQGNQAVASPMAPASIAMRPVVTRTSVDAAPPTRTPAAATSPATWPATTTPAASSEPGTSPTLDVGAAVQAAAANLPVRYTIPGVAHVWQKWNNCGPSAVLMALSAHGLQLDQLAIAAELKPDREDTNVTPEEIAAFVRTTGHEAVVGNGGDLDVVRSLVAAGIPVIAEQWINVEGRGEMGHYRVLVGYDDELGEVVAQDSYYGAARRYGYAELAAMWRPFLGAYVAVARPEQSAALAQALAGRDEATVRSRLVAEYAAQAAGSPGDAWAWYGLGEARSRAGEFEGAVEAFERAIAIGLPTRAFWYAFGYYRALVETGRWEAAVAHADATLATMSGENLEESHYWRGQALLRLGRNEEARAGFSRALEFNPHFEPAQIALAGTAGG